MSSDFEKKLFKAAIINTDELVKAGARDAGDARMTESKEDRSGSWIARIGKRIWKHNLAQEWYRQREISRARKEILESGNLYAGEKDSDPDVATDVASKEAMQAIIERFTSEYEDEMLKEEERDSKQVLEGQEINEQVKDLIKQYAGSTMSAQSFDEEKKRILSRYDKQYASKKSMYADNLLTIANEVRESVAHGTKLAELDFDVEITLGDARESLSTEAAQTGFDKGVEKLQNSKVGKYIANEPVALGITAGLYEVGRNLLQKGARGLGMGTVVGGAVVSGAVSAAKERARVTRERAQHQRESAKGMGFKGENIKRREEMELNSYETKKATMIIENLTNDLARVKEGEFSPEELSDIMGRLADVEARIKLNDQQKIDLITYDKFNRIEKDRTAMDLKRAELKVALRNNEDVEDFEGQLEHLVDTQKAQLLEGESGIEAKDEVFRKLRTSRAWKAAAKTALVGATLGTVFQEGRAFFDDSQDGIIEGSIKHFNNKDSLTTNGTALEALRRYISGDHAMMSNGAMHAEMFAGNPTEVQLPDGVTFEQNPDTTYNLVRNGEVISENIPVRFDDQGNLSAETQEALTKSGITSTFGLCGEKTTETIHATSADYVRDHGEGMKQIHRELWYDNDTPHPFDKNELKTDWGGENNTGLDAKGNYVFNVSRMTGDGSLHGAQNVDATKGGLKMLFSLSKDTQHKVFEVAIDSNGNAVIDPNSPLGKMMFENQNGHAVFTGKFAEVAQSTGVAADGGENVRILSTHIGQGKDFVDDVVSTDTTVPTVTFHVPAPNTYDAPPFIPVTGRRPLEKGEYKKNREVEANRPRTVETPEPEQSAANTSAGGEPIPDGSFRADLAEAMQYSKENGFEGAEEPVPKDADHTYAYGFAALDRKLMESRLKADAKKYKHPHTFLFEHDKSKRAENLKQLAYLKKWYPKVTFTYVALPDTILSVPQTKEKQNEYNKERLAHILKESTVDTKKVKNEFITPEKLAKPLGPVSAREFDKFVAEGTVSKVRMQNIADKLKANPVIAAALTREEQQMYLEQKEAIDKLSK